MELEEVKVCLRGLLSSTADSCNLSRLLYDFRKMTGSDLPLFGHINPVGFLGTLDDTVQLFGNPYNPEVALVQSVKSAHITSLVDRQKSARDKNPFFMVPQKRLIVPDRNPVNNYLLPDSHQYNGHTKTSQTFPREKSSTWGSNESVPHTLPHIPMCHPGWNTAEREKNEPTGNSATQGERPGDSRKGRNPYVEDISDSESCLSIEDGRGSSAAANSCFVNEGVKSKLRKLIRGYPRGLWCCELPEIFQKEYNFALDYREYGYTSLIQMLSELPDVFRCVRPGNEDWLLFDASVAPSPEEKKVMDLQAAADINCEATANVRKLLLSHFECTSDPRIEMSSILELYKKMFGRCLDFQSLGFKDLKSFLKMWEGSLFSFLCSNGRIYLVPPLKVTVPTSMHWQEALPPITAENDIFVEIFPKDVVGPEESLLELDLARHVAVGNVVKVSVAEVWSPGLFYLQLNKFKNRLDLFMDDLQRFYNVHLKKYKMPDSTLRPKQVCVGLYTSDPEVPDEWHRAQIVKVVNEKMVLVNFVDFGTETRIKKTHLRFLHRSFQSFPVQGLLAKLSGVAAPKEENKWPITTSKRFLELVRVPSLDAEIVDIDFKSHENPAGLFGLRIYLNRNSRCLVTEFSSVVSWPVTDIYFKPRMSVVLFDPSDKSGISINEKLVQLQLACRSEPHFFFPAKKPAAASGDREKARTEGPRKSNEKAPNDAGVEEITDEFSDIVDLGQVSPFGFKMLPLKHHNPSPVRNAEEGSNSIENLKYEFDDVPDLDVSFDGGKTKKGAAPNDSLLEKKHAESVSTTPGKVHSPSPEPPSCVTLPSPRPSVPVHEKLHPQIPVGVAAAVTAVEELRISSPSPAPDLSSPEVVPGPGLQSAVAVSTAPAAVASSHELQSSPQPVPYGATFVQPSPFLRHLKRLPPGLEHVSPFGGDLPRADSLRKKINTLAMELLTTNSSIKQVGLNDPVLAVKIATEMAEACLTSKYHVPGGPPPSQPDPPDLSSVHVPKPADEEPTSPSEETKDCISPQSQSASSRTREKENEYVKEIQVGGKTVHLVVIDQQGYFCAEEIIRNFTMIPGREVADRILHVRKIHMDYTIISKGTNEKVLNAIKSSQLQVVKNKSKKAKIFLVPASKVLPFLQGLGCTTKAFESEFLKLQ